MTDLPRDRFLPVIGGFTVLAAFITAWYQLCRWIEFLSDIPGAKAGLFWFGCGVGVTLLVKEVADYG
jgi:hypothetical protein